MVSSVNPGTKKIVEALLEDQSKIHLGDYSAVVGSKKIRAQRS